MPEQLPTPQITLRYNGLFDFDGLYSTITDWAKNYGYMWHEKQYKHKVPSPKGAEQEMTWILTKEVTEYLHFEVVLTVHIWDLLEVEVETSGQKKALSNARLYILMDGTLSWGKHHFKGGWFSKKLGQWHDKALMVDLEQNMDLLYYRMWNLHAIIKKYFEMQAKKHAYKGYLGEN